MIDFSLHTIFNINKFDILQILELFQHNFIMRTLNEDSQNPEFTLSYMKQNRDMNQQEQRLNIEILRVHTIEKQKYIQDLWVMNQQQLCDFFSNYQLFPQENFHIEEIINHNQLKLIKNNGKMYFGIVRNKKRQIKGINISKQGKIYEGGFYGNEKNGFGIQIYPNGNLYLGQFMNGKKHGDGKFYWFSLSSRNPKSDGFVQYYQGQWWGGLPDGFGVHQKINGDLYTGSFKNGLKHGEGSELYGNGDYYKGEFVNGMPQGYGQYTWQNGNNYKGDFKQGLLNGYGLWQAGGGRLQSYKGHYMMDKKSGYGIYTWDNGWIYKGNFQDDKRNGFGQLYKNDNTLKYRGFWENGQQVDRLSQAINSEKQKNRQRERQLNFRSVQHSRSDHKKQSITEIFAIRKQSQSNKAYKFHEINDYETVANKKDFNLAKRRPLSTTSGKKVKRQCKPQLINSSKLTSNTKANTSSSGSRVFIGTIKSNLFVPGRYQNWKLD